MKGQSSLGSYAGQAAFSGVVFALALLTALLVAGGAWAYRELSDQMARYGSYRDLQRNAGRADSLSAAYEGLVRDLEALGKALPPDNQASHVLNVLVEEARKRELGISGVTALDEIVFPGYSELPFEVELIGGFPSMVRYFHSLETQGMAVQLRRMTVKNETLNKARVHARLELSVLSPAGGTAP